MDSQVVASFRTNIARTALAPSDSASAPPHSILDSSLFTVDGGHRAILVDRFRGVIDNSVGEGAHFLILWLQKPFILDIPSRPHTFSSVSGTKDLQMLLGLNSAAR